MRFQLGRIGTYGSSFLLHCSSMFDFELTLYGQSESSWSGNFTDVNELSPSSCRSSRAKRRGALAFDRGRSGLLLGIRRVIMAVLTAISVGWFLIPHREATLTRNSGITMRSTEAAEIAFFDVIVFLRRLDGCRRQAMSATDVGPRIASRQATFRRNHDRMESTNHEHDHH